jgi:dephospho-CoA kinase
MQDNAPVTVIFVSGGIGTGKSTFTALCAERGWTVIDADKVVAALYANDEIMVAEIAQILGSGVRDSFGNVDKEFIASKIFKDSTLLKQVEAVIHPRVQKILALKSKDVSSLVYEIPVINEQTNLELADYVVVITASEQTRLERLLARGMEISDAKNRIQTQNKHNFVPKESFIIENDGSLAQLSSEVDKFMFRLADD